MAAMTAEQIDVCYNTALDVRDGKTKVAEAASTVAKETGLDVASARMYINAAIAMIDGKRFTFNISEAGVKRYLDRIGYDFGEEEQKRAARSLVVKFIEETKGNKYLRDAMLVLSRDEVDTFIEGYKANRDIWPL